MLVYDQKETDTQPPNWLHLAKVLVYVIFLFVSCIHLWRIVMLIVKIESAAISSINELVYLLIICTYINIMLFYLSLLVCDD